MLEQIKQSLEEYEKAGVELHPNAYNIVHNFHANSAGFIRYLIGEVERYKGDVEAAEIAIQAWKEHTEEQQKALEWYADIMNHSGQHSAVWQDTGERARTALQSIQGGDNT